MNYDNFSNEQALAEMERRHDAMELVDSTSGRRYHYNFMIELYNKFEAVRENWIFQDVRLLVDRFVKKVVKTVQKVFNYIRKGDNAQECFYLGRMTDSDDNFVFSKIGTTKQLAKRFQQHSGNKAYQEAGVAHVECIQSFDCGVIPATTIETRFRNYFRKLFGEHNYIRNDRFLCEFDYEETESLFNQFLQEEKEKMLKALLGT